MKVATFVGLVVLGFVMRFKKLSKLVSATWLRSPGVENIFNRSINAVMPD